MKLIELPDLNGKPVKDKAITVSIIGAIQPGPLSDYLRQAVRSGVGGDGLLQRFQLAVWPDTSKE